MERTFWQSLSHRISHAAKFIRSVMLSEMLCGWKVTSKVRTCGICRWSKVLPPLADSVVHHTIDGDNMEYLWKWIFFYDQHKWESNWGNHFFFFFFFATPSREKYFPAVLAGKYFSLLDVSIALWEVHILDQFGTDCVWWVEQEVGVCMPCTLIGECHHVPTFSKSTNK